MSAPVMMMGGLVSSCLVCLLSSIVLAVTYNSWCPSIDGACNWFPFLKKTTPPPSSPPPSSPPSPVVPPPPATPPGIPTIESPENPNPTTPCVRKTCPDGFVAHCGCSCDNPWWNGKVCTKRPAPSPPQVTPAPSAPTQRINCASQARQNTGVFAPCQGVRGNERDLCIGRYKPTCMKQPGAVWE
jgi:hypothetical protein